MRHNIQSIGARAEKLGIIGIDSERAPMTFFIDPDDKTRVAVVTGTAKAIFTRRQLEAIAAEVPEILRMYG